MCAQQLTYALNLPRGTKKSKTEKKNKKYKRIRSKVMAVNSPGSYRVTPEEEEKATVGRIC